MLPGGAFYIESKMDTDCDGAPTCPSIDSSGQTQTSWTWSGSAIDALRANYYVLPSNIKTKLGSTRLGLGDIAAVIYNGKMEFAVYADNGPTSKIGEGSVKLVQSLGFNPYRNGRICCGISSGVVVIVLPGSRGSYSSPYDSASVRQAGLSRLNELSGGSLAISDNNNAIVNESPSMVSPTMIGIFVGATVLIAVIIVVGVIFVIMSNRREQREQQP